MSLSKKPSECSVCHEHKLKKQIFKQTINLVITHKECKETRHYFRWICFGCNKKRWVTKDGIVLREGGD